ncbi:MAG: Sir2 family NAD-dependent protein deacetylase [Corynebacterium sp.]|nr:Sir2 family NAD-dependent protein deacetylase [Corynebacterium sp.]
MGHRAALKSIARVVEETVTPTDPDIALTAISDQLRAGSVMVITGAGVSTDSGIPDYRGPHGSLTRHRPMTYQEFLHDPDALHRYWARAFVGWRVMDQAQPNSTHRALAELEQRGLLSGVVTQNVDGLHLAAGSRTVVMLHGDMSHVVCLNCGHREQRTHFDQRTQALNPGYAKSIRLDATMVNPDGDVALPPAAVARFHMTPCENCGSEKLKPDVTYFGEPVDPARKKAAWEIYRQSQSVLVAGSSLAVMSGYRFALEAVSDHKPLTVINDGPGRADPKADVVWRTRVAPAFAALLARLGA